MKSIEIIFWIAFILVFYTHVGYGIVLYICVKIKELLHKPQLLVLPQKLPEVTLFIAAYNEESVVDDKMRNSLELDYPKELLHIMWVTDGSNDSTVDKLRCYDRIELLHEERRGGKMAAFNRGIDFVTTDIVIFSDANTMLNQGAIKEIVRLFTDPMVGCVSGEKRVKAEADANAAATEGIYWKYESLLKSLDYRLYSAVGAAGELFAVRKELFEKLPQSTLLDDFILSMKIAMRGYKIAYSKDAYAVEGTSLDMKEEGKRKVRIAAGGLQSVYRLRGLFNIFRYGVLSFQYISHRVLRWTLAPIALILLFLLNIVLALQPDALFYQVIFFMQLCFYAAAFAGYRLSMKNIKNKWLYIPYYFLFMNLNMFKGISYLRKRTNGVWEKAKRA